MYVINKYYITYRSYPIHTYLGTNLVREIL